MVAACQAAGGVDCTSDEVTNDNLCIVSVFDRTNVDASGAGPTVGRHVRTRSRARDNNTRCRPRPRSPSRRALTRDRAATQSRRVNKGMKHQGMSALLVVGGVLAAVLLLPPRRPGQPARSSTTPRSARPREASRSRPSPEPGGAARITSHPVHAGCAQQFGAWRPRRPRGLRRRATTPIPDRRTWHDGPADG